MNVTKKSLFNLSVTQSFYKDFRFVVIIIIVVLAIFIAIVIVECSLCHNSVSSDLLGAVINKGENVVRVAEK